MRHNGRSIAEGGDKCTTASTSELKFNSSTIAKFGTSACLLANPCYRQCIFRVQLYTHFKRKVKKNNFQNE